MGINAEWRTDRGYDNILIVDDADNTVTQAVEADPQLLTDFLNEMTGLDAWRNGRSVDAKKRDPNAWGELVVARASSGAVLDMDPELFWDGIYTWFRSRGIDPNIMVRPGR